jgi:hypothetical protein
VLTPEHQAKMRAGFRKAVAPGLIVAGRPPRLAAGQVAEIRKRYADEQGETMRKLAAAYDVPLSLIYRVVHGRYHVTRDV